jgi:hypothetical protein
MTMGKTILRDAFIEIDSVDLSDHSTAVAINMQTPEVDLSNLGGTGRERGHGLRDDSFVVTFQQNFDAASVDATLFPLFEGQSEFTVTVRPSSAAASATNPEYSATCILLNYDPLDASVGDVSTTQVTFYAQRDGITRTAGGA